MKKVFDQIVRDIKREVNKKVLKVPGIEQKVLDATSNEPWGPHGTLLADIAQASRNYHEYQMIMAVIWKRINDTGKNWRHVYKGLTVLEYLVAHGSERVIDEIREHAYQISTLSNFQYIDSSGRDQGSNVRKKSQSLVVLVNDKERIIEVRQKAAANREKFCTTSAGGMYKPGSYGDRYDDDRYEGRYGSRDDDRNGYGYGREQEYNYRDDDRYGRCGDSYSRNGDQYGRDNEDRYSKDGYRDDEYGGRSQSIDDYGSRSRGSSRGSGGARADDQSQDGRRLEQKPSGQNIAPPSYEEAVSESQSPAHSERNGETSAASVPGSSSPPPLRAASLAVDNHSQTVTPFGAAVSPVGHAVEVADEFDPRWPSSAGSTSTAAPAVPAVAATSNNIEMDLLGSLSDSFANPLAIMPVSSASTTSEVDTQTNIPGSTFASTQPISNGTNQPFEDPFGDSPFKAVPFTNDTVSAQQQTSTPRVTFQSTLNQSAEVPQDVTNNFGFGDTFSGVTYSATNVQPTSPNSQYRQEELSTSRDETDILADILPPSGPPPAVATLAGLPSLASRPADAGAGMYGNYNAQAGSVAPVAQNMGPQAPQFSSGNFLPHEGSMGPISSNMAPPTPAGPGTQYNNGNLLPQQISAAPASQFNSGNFFSTRGPVASASHHTANGPSQQFSNGNLVPQQISAAAAPQFNIGNFPSTQGSLASASHHTATWPSQQPSNGNLLPQQISATAAPQFNNGNFPSSQGSLASASHHTATGPSQQFSNGNFLPMQGSSAPFVSQATHSATAPTHINNGNFMSQHGSTGPVSQLGYNTPALTTTQPSNGVLDNQHSRGPNTSVASQQGIPSSTGSFALVSQPSKDKFETKSTVWADTLSRGLVNLNISGPKTNPLADIGVDFDAINRKEKRMEKQTTAPMTSTVTMGKAMGSGSGIGRAASSGLRAPSKPMINSGMNMGMGGTPGSGMAMGYGGMDQPVGIGMGMGMNTGMNMGMGQGGQMNPTMPGAYNPMMGTGGYSQQPFGGGYR